MARRTPPAFPLSLFDVETAPETPKTGVIKTADTFSSEAAVKLKWSHSKRGILEQCPRKFYYQYYGANRSKAKDDPAKPQLQQLKTASNRFTRTGAILHLAIADYLRKAQQSTPWERQHWLDWARSVFERDIVRSRQGLEETTPSYRRYPAQFLVEFLCEAEAGKLCREALLQMMASLEAFLDAPAFAPMRELGMQKGVYIEQHFHTLLGFPFGVEGQVDFAHQSKTGAVTVLDWKSGDDLSDGDDSLQLAVYALWAKEAFSCEAGDITLYKAFLSDKALVEFPLSEQVLKLARLKIIQDAERFVKMHEYGCAGVAEAFTPCAQEAVCRGCSFATLCPEGKESLTW